MSLRACIFTGALSLPRICRLEYDGMTEPTWSAMAVLYGPTYSSLSCLGVT